MWKMGLIKWGDVSLSVVWENSDCCTMCAGSDRSMWRSRSSSELMIIKIKLRAFDTQTQCSSSERESARRRQRQRHELLPRRASEQREKERDNMWSNQRRRAARRDRPLATITSSDRYKERQASLTHTPKTHSALKKKMKNSRLIIHQKSPERAPNVIHLSLSLLLTQNLYLFYCVRAINKIHFYSSVPRSVGSNNKPNTPKVLFLCCL